MNLETKPDVVRTTIDIPAELNERLVREAKAEKRSRHRQIIYLLEKNYGLLSGKNGEKK